MPAGKQIMNQLRKEILSLHGFQAMPDRRAVDVGLGPIKYAFPNNQFPLGAVHEFCSPTKQNEAASLGFISGIVSSLMKDGGVSLWINSSKNIFPPALKHFGIEADKIIFLDLPKRDVLWAMEEALKCNGLAAVIGEVIDLGFIESRRLQLAVEQSHVTGFVHRCQPRHLNITACVTRWKINSLPGLSYDGLPGVGHPRWNVELMKVRNGQPGTWDLEWRAGQFQHSSRIASIPVEQRRKTG